MLNRIKACNYLNMASNNKWTVETVRAKEAKEGVY